MIGRMTSAIAENPWLAQRVTIAAITPELPGVATYHLRFRDAALQAKYEFLPGQFNMLYMPGVGEIAISLSAGSAAQRNVGSHHSCGRQRDSGIGQFEHR